MLKHEILEAEKGHIAAAIIVLQNRVCEIDFILSGGKPREDIKSHFQSAEIQVPPTQAVPATARPTDSTEQAAASQAPAEVVDDGYAEKAMTLAAQAASARGEKFIAITDGVRTKRVTQLQKLIAPENHAHYNILNGTKVYAVTMDSRTYLGKFSDVSLTGAKLKEPVFYFKTPELQELYTGL